MSNYSSKVNEDMASISKIFTKYNQSLNNLKPSWEGDSYKNFSNISEDFSTNDSSIIITELSNFANAVLEYDNYKSYKKEYEYAENKYYSATIDERNKYSNLMSSYKNKMDDSKKKILNSLGKISAKISNSSASNSLAILPGNGQLKIDVNNVFHSSDYGNLRMPDNGNKLSSAGCSIYATANAMSILSGRAVTPKDVIEYIENANAASSGSRYNYPKVAANALGFNHQNVNLSDSNDVEKMLDLLENDNCVVVARIKKNSGGRYYSKEGHYIVFGGSKKVDNKRQVFVVDSVRGKNNSKPRDQVWVDFDEIKNAINTDHSFQVITHNYQV